MPFEPRIAFVTDALPSIGGAEKVLFTALDIFPSADVFTLIYNRPVFDHTQLAERTVRISLLDRLPLAHTHHRRLFPLMPAAVGQFDLHGYDIVVSMSYAVAHGVRVPAGVRHVCYMYTPMRYAWSDLNFRGEHAPEGWAVRRLLAAFRNWDRRAATRVHAFAAVSRNTARRIQQAYGCDARIIYPPVEVDRFLPAPQRADTYVTLSRLVPHKRLDLIIEAFNELGLPLIVIGEGPQLRTLQQRACPNIRFTGYISDGDAGALLQRAKGLVSASEEDFGIAIVEAQAAGCPVIAYAAGGALETVIPGRTGLLFAEQTPASLVQRLRDFELNCHTFEPGNLVENARRFSRPRFEQQFADFVLGRADV